MSKIACGQLALPKFRRQAEGWLTACVLEPDHRGNHVYCVRVPAGVDEHSHALHYMEETKRTELKPVMNVDLEGQVSETSEEDCAVIWQIMEYQKRSQARSRKQS